MEGRAAIWTLVGIVVGFKLATAIVILIHTKPASDAYGLLFATNWYFVPLLILFIAGPLLFWLRLVRVRAKRERLRRGEWDVE